MNHHGHGRWACLSLILLVVYLMFFHLCVGSDFTLCNLFGILFWAVWFSICFGWRSVFRNRFEYVIHQLVGLDILIEGFNPIHEGYGFYFCALGFWALFLSYRFIGFRSQRVDATWLQPEIADIGHSA